jgi:hypothetical protein
MFLFLFTKIFCLRKFFFVMCNKTLYQTPLSLSRKKNLYKMIQFTFFITLGFVIPNSSNNCTCQRIFRMYSYVCIMFYFCMHDGGGDPGGSLAAARRLRQLGGGSLVVAAWRQQRQCGSSGSSGSGSIAIARQRWRQQRKLDGGAVAAAWWRLRQCGSGGSGSGGSIAAAQWWWLRWQQLGGGSLAAVRRQQLGVGCSSTAAVAAAG